MVILFMTNQTMIHFAVKLKAFNIIQHQLLLLLQEEHRKLNQTIDQGQSHLDPGDGLDIFIHYIKSRATSSSSHFNNMLRKVTQHCQTQNFEELAAYQTRAYVFKCSLFPYSVMEQNQLSSSTRNSTYPVLRNHLLNIMLPVSN